MKLIDSNVEHIQTSTTYEDMWKDVVRAAQICYASEKEHDDPKEFTLSLINRHHYRPLEFGTIYMQVRNVDDDGWSDDIIYFFNDVIESNWTKYYSHQHDDGVYYANVTTNLRVIVECAQNNKLPLKDAFEFVKQHWKYVEGEFSKRYTFHWTVSRAIADEFRTHVGLSSLMQSTRYCNYASGKFDQSLTFVRPSWFEHSCEECLKGFVVGSNTRISDLENIMMRAWKSTEDFYLTCIHWGLQAQQARGVLPLDIKTEFIQCGFKDAWENFFDQRAFDKTGPAHPDAKVVATKAQKMFEIL